MASLSVRARGYLLINYVPALYRDNPLVVIPTTSHTHIRIKLSALPNEGVSDDVNVSIQAPLPNDLTKACSDLIREFVIKVFNEVGFRGNVSIKVSSSKPQQLKLIYVLTTNYLINLLCGELTKELIDSICSLDKLLKLGNDVLALRYTTLCRGRPMIWRLGEGYLCHESKVVVDIEKIFYVPCRDGCVNEAVIKEFPNSITNALVHLVGAAGIEIFRKLNYSSDYLKSLLKIVGSLNYLVLNDEVAHELIKLYSRELCDIRSDERYCIITQDIGNVAEVISFRITY